MARRTEKLYVLRVIVRGAGEFPIDMLRYMRACPETELSSYELSRSVDGPVRDVVLTAFSRNSNLPENVLDRWRSFCWAVLRVEDDDSRVIYRDPVAEMVKVG